MNRLVEDISPSALSFSELALPEDNVALLDCQSALDDGWLTIDCWPFILSFSWLFEVTVDPNN